MRTLASTHTSRTWRLQAYLASSPRYPKWCDILMNAVEGHRDYQGWDKGKLWRDPRLTQDSHGFTFVSADAAAEVLAELLQREQKYHLRVVEVYELKQTVMLAGKQITDGQVVRSPDGSYPHFMHERVAGCLDDMPVTVGLPETSKSTHHPMICIKCVDGLFYALPRADSSLEEAIFVADSCSFNVCDKDKKK